MFPGFRGFNIPVDLTPYRTFLIELAAASGDFIRPYFANPELEVELKSDQTPVTLADRGAEQLLRQMINAKFPHHGIIGEELGNENEQAEFVWMLDPIDGTKSFAAACPLFGTLICLLHNGAPVLGAIHQPILRQLLIGDNKSATLNERPVRLRATASLAEATLLTTDLRAPAKYQDGFRFDALVQQARLVRTWGDCYGYLLVSTGWADIMVDPILNPWDIGALIPVIRGAGGVITDWQGGDPLKGGSAIAASETLHPLVLAALNP